jgi:hypothetical protein
MKGKRNVNVPQVVLVEGRIPPSPPKKGERIVGQVKDSMFLAKWISLLLF